MKYFLSLVLSLLTTIILGQNFQQYVNPIIGTGGHGHTFPGATLPFGMVQLSPDTRIDGSWDGCSGYHYDDNTIYGFSHTHLNGTGCSDFGDIMLMPTMGEPTLNPKEYSSTFSHANEKATAGFYAVKLDKHNIDVQLTASTRVGFHEYTFNKDGQANIILDLNHRDKLLQGEVRIIDNKTIEILRRSEAWARDQYVYARIEFNAPMKINKVRNNAFALPKSSDTFFAGTQLGLSFSKKVKKGEKIRVWFDGWPTIVFSGWPEMSYGTFGGEIVAIENFISENGKFRVLIAPDKTEEKWPSQVRVGSGAQTIALLNTVPVWFEIWRVLNGFPPDYYKTADKPSKETKKKK